jgi:hypothetical protein
MTFPTIIMNNWTEYIVGHKISNVTNKLSKVIIEELGQAIFDFFLFDTKIRPQRTTCIKDKLALLGHNKFNFKVYANGLSPKLTQLNGGTFKNSEWLFDLHWYIEGKNPYTTTRLPLVMECEWQQKRRGDRKVPFSGIKYDFQKLLVANAEFRLMIFKIVRPTDFEQLSEYFEDNINNYKHLASGSKFLFIAFYDKGKTFYYREILK